MPLEEYRKKRNFDKTPEPGARLNGSDQRRFVVQRHQASRLHYDLRLEINGVLKSWAIPKGPSMNPRDKRLAVQTEDHPVDYLFFEGTIPKGNYGAGLMTIWDTGTFDVLNFDKVPVEFDELKLTFSGSKLKGNFTLVKPGTQSNEKHWLLIKKQDDFSTDLPYDAEVIRGAPPISKIPLPMLASNAHKTLKADDHYIYEEKYDGYRVLSIVKNGQVRMFSRNGNSLNEKFSPIIPELINLGQNATLDGEVVLVTNAGHTSFQALQNYQAGSSLGQLKYYVFDVLEVNGYNTESLPLELRKSLLNDLVNPGDSLQLVEYQDTNPIDLFHKIKGEGGEGIIAKRKDSTYIQGIRSEAWLKYKVENTDLFIVGGFTKIEKADIFSSLILCEEIDGAYQFAGLVGSGLNRDQKKRLSKEFAPIIRDRPLFDLELQGDNRKVIWIMPRLKCEVKFTERTSSGRLRHPVFLRWVNEDGQNVERPGYDIDHSDQKEKPLSDDSHLYVNGRNVKITNPEKIYWPEKGLMKFDLIDYYIQMAEYILPYLKDRPLSLHRFPNGIYGDAFFQKDMTDSPDWLDTFPFFSNSSSRTVNYPLCNNTASLIYLANLGSIELHPWHTSIFDTENPAYAVIDIDPPEEAAFRDVIEVAHAVKALLEQLKLPSVCKTSGKLGLHIYLPLSGSYTSEVARDFIHLLCLHIIDMLPDLATVERNVRQREGKIYLDYMQNKRGQTICAAYSVRAVPGATVSMPLEWSEINEKLDPSRFDIKSAISRVERKGDLFSRVLGAGINIEEAIDRLNNL